MSLHDPLPNFDQMMALHQKDPKALEALRDKMIREAIDSAPPEYRPALEHTVFQMDRARELASTPLEAAAAAGRLMSKSSDQLHSALDHLQHEAAGQEAAMVLQKLRTAPSKA